MSPTEIVIAAATALFVNFDPEAAENLITPDYIQHNPSVATGRAPVLEIIPILQQSGLEIETHRVIQEGNLVVLHSTYRNAQVFGGDTLVGFDVFRVEDGKVAVHDPRLAARVQGSNQKYPSSGWHTGRCQTL